MLGDPWAAGLPSPASMPMRIIGPPRAGAALVWKAGATPTPTGSGRSQAASQVQARAKSAMRFMVLSPIWSDDSLSYREKLSPRRRRECRCPVGTPCRHVLLGDGPPLKTRARDGASPTVGERARPRVSARTSNEIRRRGSGAVTRTLARTPWREDRGAAARAQGPLNCLVGMPYSLTLRCRVL